MYCVLYNNSSVLLITNFLISARGGANWRKYSSWFLLGRTCAGPDDLFLLDSRSFDRARSSESWLGYDVARSFLLSSSE